MTTDLLGFDSMDYNVVYAQMGRGKMERNVGFALATIAGTIAKMAFDACMFNSQNFSFVRLPKECTTGSSIMPHKKNPDVFELIRAKCNKLQALPQQVTLIMNNLPVGYFRDLQIIKEVFLPAFDELKDCLQMAAYIINKIEVREDILDNPMYDPMFSVEAVNRLAAEGLPFRDAYKKVGLDIEAGTFRPNKDIHHTHEGSIGNLCNDRIAALMHGVLDGFGFDRMLKAEENSDIYLFFLPFYFYHVRPTTNIPHGLVGLPMIMVFIRMLRWHQPWTLMCQACFASLRNPCKVG